MASPLIITVAPNGAYKQHSDHAAVPITAAQLAQTAVQCRDAGAAMLHLHIRDNEGRHSLDVQGYRDALAHVRAAVGQGMVLQVTSEAARIYAPQAQMAMVRALRPEAVSVGLRELDQADIGEHGLADFFGLLARERTMTQVILYDDKDLQRWNDLRTRRASDAKLDAVVTGIVDSARKVLKAPNLVYTKIGSKMLPVSREAMRRIELCSFAYRITGEKVFLDRAQKDMLDAAAFVDWVPSVYLCTAEMTTALALSLIHI